MITVIKSSVMVLFLFITPYITASLIGFNFNCTTWSDFQFVIFWIAFILMGLINFDTMEEISNVKK